jgi:hypothetical protein
VVNVLILVAWLWSRGGQTTDVRLVSDDHQFTVWLDGRQLASAQFPGAPDNGALVLQMESTEAIPSLPSPRGVDFIRVRDLATGAVAFEELFDAPTDNATWTLERGRFAIDRGHARALQSPSILRLNKALPADAQVDVRFRNTTGASISLRAAEDSHVTFEMRPFRHYDGRLAVITNGETTQSVPVRIEVSRTEVIKSMVAILLSFVPWLYVAGAAALVCVLILQFIAAPGRIRSSTLAASISAIDGGRLATIGAAAIAAAAFAITLWLMVDYNDSMPHVPDEVSYIFQAKVLASGRFVAPPPPVDQSFEFFRPALIIESDEGWVSIYPFGHPIVLTVGEILNVPWIIPPIIGGLAVFATFLAARRIWNTRTAFLAAVLLAASPFFLMTASNYMSHNTAALYITLCLFFLASRDQRPLLFPLLSGISFGLLFNTRPLTAIALVLPFAMVMVALSLRHREMWRSEVRSHAAWAVGGMLMLLAYAGYNWGTTGSPLSSGYSSGDLSEAIGFGGRHSVAIGIQNEQVQLSMLTMVLHNWPLWIGLGFVCLPFMLGTRKLWDWFLLSGGFAVIAVYTLYEAPGIMHGPRYWYEAMPFLVLLAARGADMMAVTLAEAARRIRIRALTSHEAARPTWAGVLVVYGFVLLFAMAGSREWLVGNGGDWVIDKMPARASELRGFNGANDGTIRAVEDAGLSNALVLASASASWQSYGTLFWKNSPDLDGNIVYARDLPANNADLFALYPDRRVYYADYQRGVLVPYGVAPDSPGTHDPEDAPRADAIPTPTVAPTATPDAAAAAVRDERRISDINEMASVINEYFDDVGSYPPAQNIQSLCTYSFDSGCLLKQVRDPLPNDPLPGRAYWYHSDGSTFFYVIAEMEAPQPESACPDPLPSDFGDRASYYCVRGP